MKRRKTFDPVCLLINFPPTIGLETWLPRTPSRREKTCRVMSVDGKAAASRVNGKATFDAIGERMGRGQ